MWHVNFLATTILVTLAQLTSSAQGFTVENQQEQLCFISDCFVARSPLLQDSVSELDCNSIKASVRATVSLSRCEKQSNSNSRIARPYFNPFNITSIGLNKVNDTAQLSITWLFHQAHAHDWTVSVVDRGTTALPRYTAAVCKTFQTGHYTTTIQGSFTDRCVTELLPGHSYDINTTSVHTDYTLSLYVPSPIHNISSADAQHWLTTLGILVQKAEIIIYILPVPLVTTGEVFLGDSKTTRESSFRIQLICSHQYLSNGITIEKVPQSQTIEQGQRYVRFPYEGESQCGVKLLYCQRENNCVEKQSHSFTTNPDLMDSGVETVSGGDVAVSGVTSTNIKPQDLYTLLGTIFGVAFLVLVIVIVLIIVYKKRRRNNGNTLPSSRFTAGDVYGDGMLLEEDVKGSAPTVLLIYSYDCQKHLACVQSFALFLQNALGCTVMTDFWATQEITERGITLWLQNKLATVNFVIVVCSTGARFKMASNRRAQLERDCDDAYLTAMSHILSSCDISSYQRLVTYFDYASPSDIPAVLDNWPRYKIPDDIDSLLVKLDLTGKDDSLVLSMHEEIYLETLRERIQSARTYMQENPNWLHANLHPNSGTRPNNLDPNIKTDNVPSSPESCHPIEVHAVDQKDIALTDPRDTADSRTVPTGSSMGLPSLDTDSLCESVEDLQYEIERMLNPIPTTRHTYNTIPHGILQLTDNYFSVLPPLNLPAQAGAHLTYANPMSSDPIIDDAAESPSSDVTAVSFQNELSTLPEQPV